MAKSKTKDTISVTQEPHPVKCELTPVERADAGLSLATALQSMETLAIEKKAVQAEFKQKEGKLSEQVHTMSLMVQNGFEMRNVMCSLELNYTTCRAKVTRLDLPGGVVEERALTDEEKNMQLPFPEKKKDKGKGKGPGSMAKTVATEQTEFEKARAKQLEAKEQSDNEK